MYNQSYDDYIRNVLGYPNYNEQNYYQDYEEISFSQNRNTELENYYPEIYNVVYPMIQKRCRNVSMPITKEKLDEMVNELYFNVEGNEENSLSRSSEKKDNKKTDDSKKETRQFNRGLNDIIRILLLRELTGRPCCSGNRPPFPPPGRPPFPPPPPGRLPYNRGIYDIYEY